MKKVLPKHLNSTILTELIWGPPEDILSADDLRGYQRWISTTAQQVPAAYFAAHPGLGKTGAALHAAAEMLAAGTIKRILVVAPLYVAENTWPDEIAKWTFSRGLSYKVVTGNVAEREAAMALGPRTITIVNRENLRWLYETVGARRWPFDLLIYDEASRLNSGRKKTKPTKRKDGTVGTPKPTELGTLSKVRHKMRVIELSGTPASKGLINLWGPIYLLDKGQRLGRSRTAFENRWFRKDHSGYGFEPFDHSEGEIMAAIKDVFFALKEEDYLDLPPLITRDHFVTLPPKALQIYRDFEREMAIRLVDGEGDTEVFMAANGGVLAGKLLQLASGSLYREDGTDKRIHTAKMDVLASIVEEAQGQPILCAYHFQFDKEAIRRKFPQTRVFGETTNDLRDWNSGRIPLMLTHPACLHPDTSVLTEKRGWVKIIDVLDDEKVFDGVEFVSHGGCRLSGRKRVIDKFGIWMTPDHKMLVSGRWVRAENVSDSESSRREARYSYEGNDPRVGRMFALPRQAEDCEAARREGQSATTPVLRRVSRRVVSPHDRDPAASDMARDGCEGYGPGEPGLGELRRTRDNPRSALARLSRVLERHVGRLFSRNDHRADRRERKLFERKLPVGDEFGAAGEQTQQSGGGVRGREDAPCRVLPPRGGDARRTHPVSAKVRDGGCGGDGIPEVDVSEEQEVYDLVNCGPRSRFVVRNATGEAFIVHNSAGHGMNFQHGSNIMVWYGLPWSAELYLQFIKRLHRSGQKSDHVIMHRILARRTIDESVVRVLSQREAVQSRITDAVRVRLEKVAAGLPV